MSNPKMIESEPALHVRSLDALTGLLDRAGLLGRLTAAWAAATAEHPLAVLFVDVDHFKLVTIPSATRPGITCCWRSLAA